MKDFRCIARGGCRSPVACGGFGYCRERNLADERTTEASIAQHRRESEAERLAMAAYEEDCRRHPRYHDGSPRVAWGDLSDLARSSWVRNPTPR